MAVPLTFRLDPIQSLVAFNMTCIGLAAVADHYYVSLFSVIATIAGPVQNFLSSWLVNKGFRFNSYFFALEKVRSNL